MTHLMKDTDDAISVIDLIMSHTMTGTNDVKET